MLVDEKEDKYIPVVGRKNIYLYSDHASVSLIKIQANMDAEEEYVYFF
jgi:hypothetical protein